MNNSLRKWIQVSFFNLLLVGGVGVTLRYKIAFALPWINQQFLLHGHSHFAFTGWVTQILMTLLVQFLSENGSPKAFERYRWLLYANLISGYGMLMSFPIEGYALVSIIFSTLSIVVSYAFTLSFIKDLKRIHVQKSIYNWFVSALFFNVLSSVGVFALAFIMASGQRTEQVYLSAVYFFLHFQYNGWFFFTCMGLFNHLLFKAGAPDKDLKQIFQMFFLAAIPTYLLSALWLLKPYWLYLLVVTAVLLQLFGWVRLFLLSRSYFSKYQKSMSRSIWIVYILVAVALTIKLVLQALAVVPSLGNFAFGFRPVVIGYLHLVLLGVITLFILGYIFSQKYLVINKLITGGLFVFIAGIIANESILLIQGLGGMSNHFIPYTDIELLGAAIMLFLGLFIINYGIFSSRYASAHKMH